LVARLIVISLVLLAGYFIWLKSLDEDVESQFQPAGKVIYAGDTSDGPVPDKTMVSLPPRCVLDGEVSVRSVVSSGDDPEAEFSYAANCVPEMAARFELDKSLVNQRVAFIQKANYRKEGFSDYRRWQVDSAEYSNSGPNAGELASAPFVDTPGCGRVAQRIEARVIPCLQEYDPALASSMQEALTRMRQLSRVRTLDGAMRLHRDNDCLSYVDMLMRQLPSKPPISYCRI
jgi:hypothetical protein